MPTTPAVRSSSGAANRMADTLLRVVGGQQVQLRVPTAAATGLAGELGLPSPQFQDYALAPVVFRRVHPDTTASGPNRYEVLVSATAIAGLLTSLAATDAEQLLQQALGLVVGGEVKLITAVTSSEMFGAPYLYTLNLRDQ